MRHARQLLDRCAGRDDLTPGQRDDVAAFAHFVADYERETAVTHLRRLRTIDLLTMPRIVLPLPPGDGQG